MGGGVMRGGWGWGEGREGGGGCVGGVCGVGGGGAEGMTFVDRRWCASDEGEKDIADWADAIEKEE